MNRKWMMVGLSILVFAAGIVCSLLFLSKNDRRQLIEVCIVSGDSTTVSGKPVLVQDLETTLKNLFPWSDIRLSATVPVALETFNKCLDVCYCRTISPLVYTASNRSVRLSLDRVSDTINTLYETERGPVLHVEINEDTFENVVVFHYGIFPYDVYCHTNSLALTNCPISELTERVFPSTTNNSAKLQIVLPATARTEFLSKDIQTRCSELLYSWAAYHSNDLTYISFNLDRKN